MTEFNIAASGAPTGRDADRYRDFTKYDHDGAWIESRRNGGEWEFPAIDTVKPYLDDRPLLAPGAAEAREHRPRW